MIASRQPVHLIQCSQKLTLYPDANQQFICGCGLGQVHIFTVIGRWGPQSSGCSSQEGKQISEKSDIWPAMCRSCLQGLASRLEYDLQLAFKKADICSPGQSFGQSRYGLLICALLAIAELLAS